MSNSTGVLEWRVSRIQSEHVPPLAHSHEHQSRRPDCFFFTHSSSSRSKSSTTSKKSATLVSTSTKAISLQASAASSRSIASNASVDVVVFTAPANAKGKGKAKGAVKTGKSTADSKDEGQSAIAVDLKKSKSGKKVPKASMTTISKAPLLDATDDTDHEDESEIDARHRQKEDHDLGKSRKDKSGSSKVLAKSKGAKDLQSSKVGRSRSRREVVEASTDDEQATRAHDEDTLLVPLQDDDPVVRSVPLNDLMASSKEAPAKRAPSRAGGRSRANTTSTASAVLEPVVIIERPAGKARSKASVAADLGKSTRGRKQPIEPPQSKDTDAVEHASDAEPDDNVSQVQAEPPKLSRSTKGGKKKVAPAVKGSRIVSGKNHAQKQQQESESESLASTVEDEDGNDVTESQQNGNTTAVTRAQVRLRASTCQSAAPKVAVAAPPAIKKPAAKKKGTKNRSPTPEHSDSEKETLQHANHPRNVAQNDETMQQSDVEASVRTTKKPTAKLSKSAKSQQMAKRDTAAELSESQTQSTKGRDQQAQAADESEASQTSEVDDAQWTKAALEVETTLSLIAGESLFSEMSIHNNQHSYSQPEDHDEMDAEQIPTPKAETSKISMGDGSRLRPLSPAGRNANKLKASAPSASSRSAKTSHQPSMPSQAPLGSSTRAHTRVASQSSVSSSRANTTVTSDEEMDLIPEVKLQPSRNGKAVTTANTSAPMVASATAKPSSKQPPPFTRELISDTDPSSIADDLLTDDNEDGDDAVPLGHLRPSATVQPAPSAQPTTTRNLKALPKRVSSPNYRKNIPIDAASIFGGASSQPLPAGLQPKPTVSMFPAQSALDRLLAQPIPTFSPDKTIIASDQHCGDRTADSLTRPEASAPPGVPPEDRTYDPNGDRLRLLNPQLFAPLPPEEADMPLLDWAEMTKQRLLDEFDAMTQQMLVEFDEAAAKTRQEVSLACVHACFQCDRADRRCSQLVRAIEMKNSTVISN